MSARCMKTSLNANAAVGHTISYTTKNGASPIDTMHYVLDSARATVASASDYYPFGLPMKGRQFNEKNFRYGLNGQEKVDEISGDGNHTTAMFWECDTRLGRRWNQDPKPNSSISNYAVFANNPILFTDLLGDTIRIEDGSKFINYTPGMEYKGDNKFVGTVAGSLNKMNTTDTGGEILSKLGSSKNNFDFTNSFESNNKGNDDIKAVLSLIEYNVVVAK